MDYAQSGTAYALAYVDSSSLYLGNGTATSSASVSGLAVGLKTARYGSTVYAVYSNSVGDAFLVYGVPGAALTTAPLEPGFNVRDVDIWASSSGALIVAALSTGDVLAFMSVEI